MTDRSARRDTPGLLGCGLAVLVGVAALAYSGGFSPLGSVFPRTIGGLMIVLALLYTGLALRRPQAATAPAGGSTLRRAGTAAVLLAWAFALQPLGFLFSSICGCIALLLLAQHDRWTPRTGLVYGLATMFVLGALYVLFRFVLKVPLPVGVFW
ncbi:MAG: tripartite tricarboxylate transporter TctB family protein [Rhizobacter sp.]|nr:tripartite tricarboxylate transporter TctB family protein [Rhizobacter sp.]